MSPFFLLPFVGGFFALVLAAIGLVRRTRSIAVWCFSGGLTVLGLDSLFTGLSLRAIQLGEPDQWLRPALVVKCMAPALWLAFSLTYSRNAAREILTRWKVPLGALAALPAGVWLLVSRPTPDDFWWLRPGLLTTTLNVVLLIALVAILANLEQTLRSAVGTMRWHVKFVVLGLGVIVAARLYVRSQAILFSEPDLALWPIESGALLVGCIVLTIARLRTGWDEIDVYPSLAVLRSSLTILIVGGYLLVVGGLAQLVRRVGGAEIFQFQAIVVLLGMTGLAVLLLSDRARRRIHVFVLRHFRKAQHDSVRLWTQFSHALASVTDETALCASSAKVIAETFDVLSLTIWLVDAEHGRLIVAASTAPRATHAGIGGDETMLSCAIVPHVLQRAAPFDLDDLDEPWAEELRQRNSKVFPHGGTRICVPLRAGHQLLGLIVLADRVNGAVYTFEELELLKCIADQMTSVLLNLRLAHEVAQAKELEAFRTMSAFFVHDLKNTATSLNLMLKNLPIHFDDPAFREDALRSVSNSVRRIDETVARLTALRRRSDAARIESDLNQLVAEALDGVNGTPNVELTRELQSLPAVLVDREQIRSVITNLVLNAKEAVGSGGLIRVRTENRGERAVLSVADNGCGMTAAFVRESLFRPFQSTKQKGLGIGLFQSRAIVQAHGGRMQVESEPGKGTTFLVSLPLKDA